MASDHDHGHDHGPKDAGTEAWHRMLHHTGHDQLSEDTSGSYAGLGLEVLSAEGTLRVIAPIDDTPADRAGIKPGDIITRIDDKAITTDNVNEAVNLLRGNPGSSITLGVLHEGASAPIDLKLTRETIRVASVRVRPLDPGYVYIRVAQFQEGTSRELTDALHKLDEQSGDHVEGVILDLRHNPGGLLNEAVKVSDLFLDAGLIVYTEGRGDNQKQRFLAHNEGTEPNKPNTVVAGNPARFAKRLAS